MGSKGGFSGGPPELVDVRRSTVAARHPQHAAVSLQTACREPANCAKGPVRRLRPVYPSTSLSTSPHGPPRLLLLIFFALLPYPHHRGIAWNPIRTTIEPPAFAMLDPIGYKLRRFLLA